MSRKRQRGLARLFSKEIRRLAKMSTVSVKFSPSRVNPSSVEVLCSARMIEDVKAEVENWAPEESASVFVSFVVKTDGELSDLKVIKGHSEAYDQKAKDTKRSIKRFEEINCF